MKTATVIAALFLVRTGYCSQVHLSDFSCGVNSSIQLLSIELGCGEDHYCSFGEDVNVTAWVMDMEPMDLCNISVSLTGSVCPADGSYEVTVPYTIPTRGSFMDWLTTGFTAVADVDFYDLYNNSTYLMGSCALTVSSKPDMYYVEKLERDVPIPTASIVTMVVGGIIFVSVGFALFRGANSDDKKKSLIGDDQLEDGKNEPDPIEAMRTRTFD